MNALGHNERSYRLDTIAAEARQGLEKVEQGEEFTIAGWLAYGHALNEGRALFPGDREFGQWVKERGLHLLSQSGLTRESLALASCREVETAEVSRDERAAAMWAAANADQFEEARQRGNPRTIRGIHAKWKEIESERERERLEEERRQQAEADSASPAPEAVGATNIGKQSAEIPAERADIPPGGAAGGAGMDVAAHSGPADTAEAATEATPDPHAKLRRQLASLSREGLEDEVIGLREALAEEKAKLRDTKAKLKEARETIASHTADDKDEAIRRQAQKLKHYERQMYEANAKFDAEKRKNFALNKRVKELESMGIPLC